MELVLLGTALLGGLLWTVGTRAKQVSTRTAGQFLVFISLLGLAGVYATTSSYGFIYR